MKNIDFLAGRFAASDLSVFSAKGAILNDQKGNDYIDFVLGNLTQISGHSNLQGFQQLASVLERFTNVGDQRYEEVFNFASRILTVANKASLRFTNSGSEAAHLAIRLARAATGRKKIVKFVAHYHGWFNEEIGAFLPSPASTGLSSNVLEDVIVVSWNSRREVELAFEANRGLIAAVVCEPVLAHAGTIPPYDGFLEFLREITNNEGAGLIFDECITGFRVALGGAQELYNVQADLVVYSKAISNGFPLGIVAGTEQFMAAASSWSVFHASTFDCNPLSVAMGTLVLDELENGQVLPRVHRASDSLCKSLIEVLHDQGHDVTAQAAPGFFQIYFTTDQRIADYEAAMATDWKKTKSLCARLKQEKIIVSPGELWSDDPRRNWMGSWFLSASHTDEIIDRVLGVVQLVSEHLGHE